METKNINCKLIFFSNEDEDSRFQNVKLQIVHAGENSKGLNITEDAIENAKESLKNIPIVGYIERDEDDEAIDFGGHKIYLKLSRTSEGLEVRTFYEERAIGVIPESTEITYETDEETEKTYLCATGKIWKAYANEGLDLLLEAQEKSVSMEIIIQEKNDEGDITSFIFQGITILGDDVEPGIEGATITTYAKGNLEFYKKELQLICNELNKEKEGIKLPENKKTIEMFGLSVQNFQDQIYDALTNRTVEQTNYWGETYQQREFYYRDIIPGENIVVVESASNYSCFGVPYSLDGDKIVLDFDNKKAYIREWREMNEGESQVNFSLEKPFENELEKVAFEKINELNELIKTLETSASEKDEKIKELDEKIVGFSKDTKEKDNKLSELNSELERLKAFEKEVNNEKLKENVANMLEKFSLEEDEIKELKEKVLSGELEMDLFEKELFALEGKKAIENRAKQKSSEPKSVKVADHTDEPVRKRPYGDILD